MNQEQIQLADKIENPLNKVFVSELISWPEIEKSNYVYGGIAFKLFNKNLGHIHFNGCIDYPFKGKLRNWLLCSSFAELHHFAENLQWVSAHISTNEDLNRAIQLMELSYWIKGNRYFQKQPAALEFISCRLSNNTIYKELKKCTDFQLIIAEQL